MFATSVDMWTYFLHGMSQQVEQTSEVGRCLSNLRGCTVSVILLRKHDATDELQMMYSNAAEKDSCSVISSGLRTALVTDFGLVQLPLVSVGGMSSLTLACHYHSTC